MQNILFGLSNLNYCMWAPRYCNKGIPVPRVLVLPQSLQKSPKFRVRVWGSYRTFENSGYGTDVLQNTQKFRVLWHGRTELTYVMKMIYLLYPGCCVCHSLYRSRRSSGLEYGGRTEHTDILGTVRKCYRTHRSSGYCGTGVQNSHTL